MLIDFIFLLILFGLVYSYTSSQNQFAATASAIRQIWSGSCRLSCRQSEHSGHSAMSGLSALPAASGPSRDCHCEACPCGLIDNFLSSWRPATTMYSQLVESLSDFITFVLQMFMDTYEYLMRVFECNVSCQHTPVIAYKRSNLQRESYSSSSFEKGEKGNIKDVGSSGRNSKQEVRLQDIKPEKRDVKREKNLIDEEDNNVGTSKAVPIAEPVLSIPKALKDEADVVMKPSKTSNSPMKLESSSESLARKGYCSKCVEKGRTCIKECPRAKK